MDIVYEVDYRHKDGDWKPIVNTISRPIDAVDAARLAKLCADYYGVEVRIREEYA